MNLSYFETRLGEKTPYIGPHLSFGPLPTVFYFSLSAEESLTLNPFNTPVTLLSKYPFRIFSINLPGHETSLSHALGIVFWAHKISQGINFLFEFLNSFSFLLEDLKKEGLLIPKKVAVAGLSRGAFIATHAAAHFTDLDPILGFAPLSNLSLAKEFQMLQQHSLTAELSLENVCSQLIGRSLRFYIGNCDSRVGTKQCFSFIEKLSGENYQNGIRSPKVELLITASIGHLGHGTAEETFQNGTQWLIKKLESESER